MGKIVVGQPDAQMIANAMTCGDGFRIELRSLRAQEPVRIAEQPERFARDHVDGQELIAAIDDRRLERMDRHQ